MLLQYVLDFQVYPLIDLFADVFKVNEGARERLGRQSPETSHKSSPARKRRRIEVDILVVWYAIS